jgi:hypothetical protein
MQAPKIDGIPRFPDPIPLVAKSRTRRNVRLEWQAIKPDDLATKDRRRAVEAKERM